jgi:hypothetical protein
MEIFFSKLVVFFLSVRRNLCIRAEHYIICTADSTFHGRCNYGICRLKIIVSINKYIICDENSDGDNTDTKCGGK